MRQVKPVPFSVGGVPLLAVRITDDLGRTWAVHQSPGAEHAELEDVGRAPSRHDIEAVVWGPTWVASLDALRLVVETPLEPAPLALHHPWWGVIIGVVQSLQITHEDKQLDFAMVRLTFVGGRSLVSREATQTAAAALAAARTALADARAALEVL